jgi:hypothetical protein
MRQLREARFLRKSVALDGLRRRTSIIVQAGGDITAM